MEASANVTREEFNTAIGDISAKMETLMMTMSQVVHGTAPTATGDGRRATGESHGAGGTPFQAPNKKGLISRLLPILLAEKRADWHI